MRTKDWNTFIIKNPSAMIFGSIVSSRLPVALITDPDGNKLPTPYKLFCMWLEKNLADSWSTVAVPVGFVVGLTSLDDKNLVTKTFGPIKHRGFKFNDQSIPVINYMDGSYATLAAALGYRIF